MAKNLSQSNWQIIPPQPIQQQISLIHVHKVILSTHLGDLRRATPYAFTEQTD